MVSIPRTLLVGRRRDRLRPHLLLAPGLCVLAFVGYATGLFAVAGGVVFVPGHAALLGLLGAAWVGFREGGLAVAWAVAYAPLFAFNAEWGLLSLSGRSLSDKLAFVFSFETLAVLGGMAVVFGTVAFVGGWAAREFAPDGVP